VVAVVAGVAAVADEVVLDAVLDVVAALELAVADAAVDEAGAVAVTWVLSPTALKAMAPLSPRTATALAPPVMRRARTAGCRRRRRRGVGEVVVRPGDRGDSGASMDPIVRAEPVSPLCADAQVQ
jgi:hypothetical protein